jgi:hypothetical protein
MQQCLQHGAQCSQRCSWCSCVLCRTLLDGQESNCMELLALCTVLSMLLPTGLICDLTGTGSQAQSTAERNAAGRQQGNQPLAMSAVPASCTSAWSLLRTLAYGMHSRRKRMFERCRQATQQSHARRRLDARVELVYQCLRNLQCLVRIHSWQKHSA